MKLLKRVGYVLLVVLVLEFSARAFLGLGDPPLYVESLQYEYIYAPNQEVTRFGNRIITNEYSMRSGPITDNDGTTILKIGDSVIHGGSLTDHDSLATTMLEEMLRAEVDKNARVLNVSAGSWGPDNALGYVLKHGHFNADLAVMVFSSHDVADIMGRDPIVGVHRSYPDAKPISALWEGFYRYFLPIIGFDDYLGAPKQIDGFNRGWIGFIEYMIREGIPLQVVLHPTTQELAANQYNEQGQELIKFLKKYNVPVHLELEHGGTPDMYSDNIHYNNKGQKHLARQLYPMLKQFVSTHME